MNSLIKVFVSILLLSTFSGCKKIKQQISFIQHKNHIAYIESNPDSLKSAKALMIMATTFGRRKTSELFEPLTPRVKDSDHGRLIAKYLQIGRDPVIGDKYVDFTMPSLNGEMRMLSELEGQIILLEFWASWCRGCIHQVPHLKQSYKEFHDQGFEIFAVSYDYDRENLIKTIENKELNWKHVTELKHIGNTAGLIYGVSSIPDNFLIDDNGTIVARDLKGEELHREIRKLLKNRNTIH